MGVATPALDGVSLSQWRKFRYDPRNLDTW